MKRYTTIFISFSLSLVMLSCDSARKELRENAIGKSPEIEKINHNLLTEYIPLYEDGDVNAVIEIPSGTMEKWELDKSTGRIEWELINNKPRMINYIGYPGNYGMIPRTLLSKDQGGDGDPLDIIVLGPPEERGSVVKCKIIGVLYLMDREEQDDKLIAVSTNSALYEVNNLNELKENYVGVAEIIKLWFTNYKGPGKMESKGYGDKSSAIDILESAINQYKYRDTKTTK